MSGSLLTLLRELARREIDFIVVGGMAGVLHGAPVVTADVDIVHRRTDDNVAKLLALLEDINATFRSDSRRLKPNASHLQGKGHILLMTSLGPLDVLCELAGEGYDELVADSVEMDLGRAHRCRVVELKKLILLKELAGREKDKLALPTLRATLAEKQRSGR